MTSKQRAYLKSLASNMEAIVHVGKAGASPEVVMSVQEALNARELIKIGVLKNCADDPRDLAQIIADRTHSQVVHVIGKKIVLYKPKKDKPVIKLPLD
ncbi:MAG: ribosome assembly RNA-binding protein YhbY [Lachnospiraceae bacterium]|nr:ribosome assembly RNA-binding protein YhbY [Lachnospiraceae bacterium]